MLIFFVLLAMENAAFQAFPIFYMFLLLILPVLVVIGPLWIIIVYLIGKRVQQRSENNNMVSRITVALLCSFAVLMVFPLERGLRDLMKWGHADLDFFTDGFGGVAWQYTFCPFG